MHGMASRPITDPSLEVASPGLLCCRCRYDLRGQPSNGKCPECGELVEISVERAANPLKRPRGGLALGLGLVSVLPIFLIFLHPVLSFASPMLSLSGLVVSIVSLSRWRGGTTAQRVMSVLGVLINLASMVFVGLMIYALTHLPVC